MPEVTRYPASAPPRQDFQPKWQEARACCEKLLRWHLHTDLRGNELLSYLASSYTKIYRLVSSPASNVPGLVRNDNEQVSAPDAEGTQVLVLYYLLRELLKNHLDLHVRPQLKPSEILKTYADEWQKYSIGLNLVVSTFRFLHSHWSKKDLPPGHVTMTTRSLGLVLWGDGIIAQNREGLSESVLGEIRKDRENPDTGNSALVRRVLSTFDEVCAHDPRRHQAYSEVFEVPLLNDLRVSYQTRVAAVLSPDESVLSSATERAQHYIVKANEWFSTESTRFEKVASNRSTLPHNAKRQLTMVLVEENLPCSYLLEMFQNVVAKKEETESLQQIFQLTRWSELFVQKMCESLNALVTKRLSQEIDERRKLIEGELSPNQPEPRGSALLEAVLETYRPFQNAVKIYEVMVSKATEPEQARLTKFRKALRTALTEAIASFSTSSSPSTLHIPSIRFVESLARYCNAQLRSKLEMEEKKKKLAEAADVLDFLHDRDVFSTCYQHFLSQRLIARSYDDTEADAIQVFRLQWGRDFTYRWERMYNESSNKQYNRLAEECVEEQKKSAVAPLSSSAFELLPMILSSAWWPVKITEPPMAISGAVGQLLENFYAKYKQADGNRTLLWSLQHTTAVVQAQFGQTLFDFTITPYQWEIFQLFNEDLLRQQSRTSEVSFEQIKQRTGQSTELLQRALFALINGRLLVTVDERLEIVQQSYRVNVNYTNANRKVQFLTVGRPQPTANDNGSNSGAMARGVAAVPNASSTLASATQHAISERRYAVQAAIVRSVKTRRTVSYQQIVSDVENTLSKHKFHPTSKDIKHNLEILIEKEYLERSAEDPSVFIYLS